MRIQRGTLSKEIAQRQVGADVALLKTRLHDRAHSPAIAVQGLGLSLLVFFQPVCQSDFPGPAWMEGWLTSRQLDRQTCIALVAKRQLLRVKARQSHQIVTGAAPRDQMAGEAKRWRQRCLIAQADSCLGIAKALGVAQNCALARNITPNLPPVELATDRPVLADW